MLANKTLSTLIRNVCIRRNFCLSQKILRGNIGVKCGELKILMSIEIFETYFYVWEIFLYRNKIIVFSTPGVSAQQSKPTHTNKERFLQTSAKSLKSERLGSMPQIKTEISNVQVLLDKTELVIEWMDGHESL